MIINGNLHVDTKDFITELVNWEMVFSVLAILRL